jgi:hypothetical protein
MEQIHVNLHTTERKPKCPRSLLPWLLRCSLFPHLPKLRLLLLPPPQPPLLHRLTLLLLRKPRKLTKPRRPRKRKPLLKLRRQ